MRSNKLYLKYFIFKYNIKKIVDIILQIKKKIKKTKIKKILLFKNFKNVNLKIIKLFQKKKYILSSIDIKQNSLIIEEEKKKRKRRNRKSSFLCICWKTEKFRIITSIYRFSFKKYNY